MTNKDNRNGTAFELRKRAEALARKNTILSPEKIKALSPEEIQQMFHELQVHQIELEMQNEELRRSQAELDAARVRYFDLYDLAPVGYFTVNGKGLILEANLKAATLLGVTRVELVKQPISRFILKEDQNVYYLHRKTLLNTEMPQECDLRIMKNDGTSFWAHLMITAVQDTSGAFVSRIVMSDISERKKAEEQIANEKYLQQLLLDHFPGVVLLLRTKTREVVASNQAGRNLGVVCGSICFETWWQSKSPCPWCLAPKLWATGKGQHAEIEAGGRMWEAFWVPVTDDLYMHYSFDITERKRTEEQLKALLSEKEVLLKEVHHRVKNNLQIILSLISLQSDNLTDEKTLWVLSDVGARIRSIALVHEMLYRSNNLAQLDFAVYAADLLQYLWRAGSANDRKVSLNLSLAPLLLPIDLAVNCGLILNELATNALKHAFPDNSVGDVTVVMEHDSTTGDVCLTVSDNGIGLPVDFDWRQSSSLGLNIVKMLAGQIRASVQTGPGPGTEFRIKFNVNGSPS